jgi:hypothetical protein
VAYRISRACHAWRAARIPERGLEQFPTGPRSVRAAPRAIRLAPSPIPPRPGSLSDGGGFFRVLAHRQVRDRLTSRYVEREPKIRGCGRQNPSRGRLPGRRLPARARASGRRSSGSCSTSRTPASARQKTIPSDIAGTSKSGTGSARARSIWLIKAVGAALATLSGFSHWRVVACAGHGKACARNELASVCSRAKQRFAGWYTGVIGARGSCRQWPYG